jgi:hypothetical protein
MNRGFLVALAIVCTALHSFAQSQTASGDIHGAVTDTTGGVLPGAVVTVTNLDTGIGRSAVSDDAGNFRFFLLPPASYEVRARYPGFSDYVNRPVVVNLGDTVSIEIN